MILIPIFLVLKLLISILYISSVTGDELENLQQYYETIYNKDFVNYKNHVHNQAILSAIKVARDDIYFKHDFLKRYKRDIEKHLISNSIFVKKKNKKTLCTADDCKKLKF